MNSHIDYQIPMGPEYWVTDSHTVEYLNTLLAICPHDRIYNALLKLFPYLNFNDSIFEFDEDCNLWHFTLKVKGFYQSSYFPHGMLTSEAETALRYWTTHPAHKNFVEKIRLFRTTCHFEMSVENLDERENWLAIQELTLTGHFSGR